MSHFALEFDASGIDPGQDQITAVCLIDLDNDKGYYWCDEPIPTMLRKLLVQLGSQRADIVTLNGHRFTAPLLAKELKRFRMPLPRGADYHFWDMIYCIEPVNGPGQGCRQRLEAALGRLTEELGNPVVNEAAKEQLVRANELEMARQPQEPRRTRYYRSNATN